ncbi:GNAT family N-acetyltransferase [Amycolatopsis mongoliensis]|uniref:GNAT family N-acetyltransferase n=1 Tax=Amycolatopsis mongoliensis TaxID=715475 RepID=A0A9Y2JUU2_9PSEU|nr:GNAT family N-acetyltransferase [Amycolatopsis sp. 4-36]WIY04628.1 GNAT family N-acetyltransferase [Amycolatopsis sp. 4-36]
MIRVAGPDDWAGAPEQRWRDRFAGTHNVIAESDGRAVGMATGFPRGDTVELGSMWVAPHTRRRGVGEALVRAILDRAGTKPVTLQVAADNRDAASLYRRLGFTGDGRLVSAGLPG